MVGLLPITADTSSEAWKGARVHKELVYATAYQIAVIKTYLLVYPPNQISMPWAYAMPCGKFQGIPAQMINEAVRRCMRDWEEAGGASRYKNASTFLERDSDLGMREDMLQYLVDIDSACLDLDHRDAMNLPDCDDTKFLGVIAASLGMDDIPGSWTNGIGNVYLHTWGILADWIIGIQKHANNDILAWSLNNVLDLCETRAKAAMKASPDLVYTIHSYNGSRPSLKRGSAFLADTSPKPNYIGGALTCDSLWGLKSAANAAAMPPPPPVPPKLRTRKKRVTHVRHEYSPGLDEFAIRRLSGLYFASREDGVRVYKL